MTHKSGLRIRESTGDCNETEVLFIPTTLDGSNLKLFAFTGTVWRLIEAHVCIFFLM